MKKKHIAEDLPSRPHPQASLSSQSKPSGSGGGERDGKKGSEKDGESTPDKRIRQAVYDIKYRARRENVPLRTAYSQYMQNSSMSEVEKSEVRKRLFGDGGSGGGNAMRAEDFDMEIKDFASHSMMNTLYKVFVEKTNYIDDDQLKTELEEKTNFNNSNKGRVKKYKVRVHDPDSGVTYVRYATREKINELRAKGLDVEMTEYGTPYEGERKKGEKTSEVLGKKAKGDYDGDGKVESGAKEHAGAVHNAIQRKKGGVPDGKDTSNVKESYFYEVSTLANLPQVDSSEYVNPNANIDQIDLTTRKNKITVNPPDNRGVNASNKYNSALMAHHVPDGEFISENGYSRFLNLLQEKKMTAAKKKKEKKLKAKYDESGMKASMQKQYGTEKGKKVYFASIRKQAMKEESEGDCGSGEMDKRDVSTKVSIAKSKLQSMGIKNPIVMAASYEPEGEVIDERRREDKGKPRPKRNAAMEYLRKNSPDFKGMMTRSGRTVGEHEGNRGKTKLQRQEDERTTNPETGGKVRKRPPNEGLTPQEKVDKKRAQEKPEYPDNVYSKNFIGGIRGYTSG
jgi:hypothetical protein